MPGPVALVTVAEVKTHLNIAGADHDAELQGFIDGVQPVIEDIVGHVVQTAPITEQHDGGRDSIALRHRPVISITSVTEYVGPTAYPLTVAATPDVASTYSYLFDPPARLVRRGAGGAVTPFRGGKQSIWVVYIAGRGAVPANVRMGTLELIRHNYMLSQQGSRPAFGGPGTEEEIATPSGFAVPARVMEWLQPNFRHPSIA